LIFVTEDDQIQFFRVSYWEAEHRSKCLAYAYYFVERGLPLIEYYYEIEGVETNGVFIDIRDYLRKNIDSVDTKTQRSLLRKLQPLKPIELQLRYTDLISQNYYACALFDNVYLIFEYAIYVCRKDKHTIAPHLYSQWNSALFFLLDYWERRDTRTLQGTISGSELKAIIANRFGLHSVAEEHQLIQHVFELIQNRAIFSESDIERIATLARQNQA
jgi:hypothetical protein